MKRNKFPAKPKALAKANPKYTLSRMRSRLCLLLVGKKKKNSSLPYLQWRSSNSFFSLLYLFFVLWNTFNYDDSFSSGTICQHFLRETRSMSRTHVDYVHIFSALHFSVFFFPGYFIML